jgi:S-layer protein (TIGR01567 family)
MYIIDSHSRIELRNNKSITLKKDSIIPLFGNIGFKVADSVELRFMPIQLRFENYRSASISPDEFEIYTLTPSNFDGFYYDIDNDLGTEQLILTATYGNTFYEPEGVIYSTTAQKERFRFSDWGYFKVIGFLGEKYFAGYVLDENIPPDYQIQYAKSIDKDSLYNGQLQRILMDDDREITIVSGTPLKLGEGYELSIKSIDINGNMVYLELYKDGALVETKAISPYMDNPTMSDRTYYYKKDVGDQKELVIISVCFKNAFRGVDANVATIEGIWQISEDITKVTTGTEYVKMRIASVTANTITMDNKDNSIKLGKNKKIDLMGDISIETADDDDTRYLIKKSSTNIGLSDSLVS